jgi:hypothetical protein
MGGLTLLPGVYFQTAVPAVPEALPRLDIAAFVGFAASGPLNIPVVVEDAVRFHEIFGQEQPLAWDAERGEMMFAQLAPAVRSFFRNGGRRCWIVRVARDGDARSNQFVLPGLLQVTGNLLPGAAWVQARSEGSWSDAHAVNTTLSYAPIQVKAMRTNANGYEVELDPLPLQSVAAGDLIQIVFSRSPSGSLRAGEVTVYLPVSSVKQETLVPEWPETAERRVTLLAERGHWFESAAPEDFPGLAASPPNFLDATAVSWLPLPTRVLWLTREDNRELAIRRWGVRDSRFVFVASRSDAQGVPAGSWLRVEFDSSNLPSSRSVMFVQVEKLRGSSAGPLSPPLSSPPEGAELVEIAGEGAWWLLDENTGKLRSSNPMLRSAALTLELWVRNGSGELSRLNGLGLAPLSARYLGSLPTDAQMFASRPAARAAAATSLSDEVARPRFPLAARPSLAEPDLFLPLGVPGSLREECYQQAVRGSKSPLERDGLEKFSPELFLDPDLEDKTSSELLAEAFYKQFQRPSGQRGKTGEALSKLHAVLPLEEVSLIAVPDATHPGWEPSNPPQDVLTPPQQFTVEVSLTGSAKASWTPVERANSYTLEESKDPRFVRAKAVWEGRATQFGPLASPDDCATVLYYRVRANGSLGPGPWSETRRAIIPSPTFAACDAGLLEAPALLPLSESRGRTVLEWSGALGTDTFSLEVSGDPTFRFAEVLYEGEERKFSVWRPPGSASHFRVAAQRGRAQSPWSNTVSRIPLPLSTWQMKRPAASPLEDVTSDRGTSLLRVHEAMLRLCAARGDVLALLSMPLDFRSDAALRYQERLALRMRPDGGDRTLSFGALYHPWLVSGDTQGFLRRIAPDGTICGSLAARTLSAGPWYSSANQLLSGILALDPELGEASRFRLFTAQVNRIANDVRGFLATSSATLSGDSELREINVRRLLILLRRLALREGVKYVFEPNDESFRRRVRRGFETLLGDLYIRGALAGASHEQAYRVVTDRSVNPAESVEQVRFVVELRVAPSRPLAFLTVRLVQSGNEFAVTEET